MDAQPSKSSSFGSKNCKTRSAMQGKKRPHEYSSTKTETSPEGVVSESRICSWCGVAKWTTTS